ncbi:hypothetical protein ACI2K4_27335 [Micromonospora sp. NPDC050397]|uniref:hypothetical protein n=1 Tax=Micromonospora sp. NPDC050397 TaxID=3364279 RepID=UPI00384D390C
MTGSGDEEPVPLRIGGWLPPSGRPARPEEAAATALLPVIRRTDPEPTGAGTESDGSRAGRARRRDSRRWRVTALVAVATVATAVGVPLLAGGNADPADPDRQAQPAPPRFGGSADPAADPAATAAVDGSTTAGSSAAASRGGSRSTTTTTSPGGGPAATTGAPGTSAAPPPSKQPNQPNALPPAAPPSVFGTSVEAEGPAAERRGRARTRSVAGASGGTVVTGIGDGSGNTIRFSRIEVPAAGRYTVTLYYVSDRDRSGTLTVNGGRSTVSFADTGSNDGPVGAVSITLSLRAGANSIELGDRRERVADLDRIVVTGSGG